MYERKVPRNIPHRSNQALLVRTPRMRDTSVIGTDRRRGQRIRSSVKMAITSLHASMLFNGLCNTGTVSFYGCDFLSFLRFKPGTPLRLEFPDTQRTTTARVVHSLVAKVK